MLKYKGGWLWSGPYHGHRQITGIINAIASTMQLTQKSKHFAYIKPYNLSLWDTYCYYHHHFHVRDEEAMAGESEELPMHSSWEEGLGSDLGSLCPKSPIVENHWSAPFALTECGVWALRPSVSEASLLHSPLKVSSPQTAGPSWILLIIQPGRLKNGVTKLWSQFWLFNASAIIIN